MVMQQNQLLVEGDDAAGLEAEAQVVDAHQAKRGGSATHELDTFDAGRLVEQDRVAQHLPVRRDTQVNLDRCHAADSVEDGHVQGADVIEVQRVEWGRIRVNHVDDEACAAADELDAGRDRTR